MVFHDTIYGATDNHPPLGWNDGVTDAPLVFVATYATALTWEYVDNDPALTISTAAGNDLETWVFNARRFSFNTAGGSAQSYLDIDMTAAQPIMTYGDSGRTTRHLFEIDSSDTTAFLCQGSLGRDFFLINTSGMALSWGNTSDNPTYNYLGSGAFTFGSGAVDISAAASLEIPNSTTPTVSAAGHVGVDTDFHTSGGVLKFHDGTQVMVCIAVPEGDMTTTDGHVAAYDTTANHFLMEAQAGGGGTLEAAYTGGNTIQITDTNPIAVTHSATATSTNYALSIAYSAQAYTGTPHGVLVDWTAATSLSNAADVYGLRMIGETNAGAGDSVAISIDSAWDQGIENANSYDQTAGNFNVNTSGTVRVETTGSGNMIFTLPAVDNAFIIRRGGENFFEIDASTHAIHIGNSFFNPPVNLIGGGNLNVTMADIDMDPTGTYALTMTGSSTCTTTVVDSPFRINGSGGNGTLDLNNSRLAGATVLDSDHTGNGTLTANTLHTNRFTVFRYHTGATTVSDNFNGMYVFRENRSNHASATLNAAGAVLYVENKATETLGTLNDTVRVLELVENNTGTHEMAHLDQNGTGDAALRWSVPAQNWIAGIDNSNNDNFKLAPATTVSSNTTLQITPTRVWTISCGSALTASYVVQDAGGNDIFNMDTTTGGTYDFGNLVRDPGFRFLGTGEFRITTNATASAAHTFNLESGDGTELVEVVLTTRAAGTSFSIHQHASNLAPTVSDRFQWFTLGPDSSEATGDDIDATFEFVGHVSGDATSTMDKASISLDVGTRALIYNAPQKTTDGGFTGKHRFELADNVSTAIEMVEGSNSYLSLDTTNGSEIFKLGLDDTTSLTQIYAGDYISLSTGAATDADEEFRIRTVGASTSASGAAVVYTLTPPNAYRGCVRFWVICNDTTGNTTHYFDEYASWEKSGAGTLTGVSNVSHIADNGGGSAHAVDVNATGGDLQIRVVPANTNACEWELVMFFQETAGD
jgi:hypothetical protein